MPALLLHNKRLLTRKTRCDTTIYFYDSNAGGCDAGSTGECFSSPWTVEPGSSDWVDWDETSSGGTSIKISKTDAFDDGILQFEYARTDGIYWDLSDIDGSPFRDDGVTVTPSGDGAGDGNCTPLACSAGTVCDGAFQNPDDPDVRFCPLSVDEFIIDLCM